MLLLLLLLLAACSGRAADAPVRPPPAERLRARLAILGMEMAGSYSFDAWRNLSGGSGRGSRGLGHLDLQATMDGETALGLKGTRIFIHVQANHGGRPNDLVGSHAGIDNIEVPVPAFKLYEAGVQQELGGGRASLLAGLLDLNSEFYVTESSGLFLNPTYGIGTEMAVSGVNGPSIFPTTSLAARVAIQPTPGSYLRVALFDAVAGDPANGRGTHLRIARGEGALLVAEAGRRREARGYLAIGAWRYTARRPSLLTSLPVRSGGVYFLAEREIDRPGDRKCHVFARVGLAPGDADPFRSSWSAGAVWTGLVGARPEGRLGLGVSQTENGDAFMAASGATERRETQVELTWEDRVWRGVTVQPDLQYTADPGTTAGPGHSWTAGLRLTVGF